MNTSSGGATQTVGPPSWQLPYIKEGFQGAQQLYQQNQGPVPLSTETNTALTNTAARAQNGSPLTAAAQELATNTINGGFLGSNPYLDATFNRAALQTQNQLASEFARSGRNVGASEGLRAQQLNDLATGIYGGAYDSERNRQQQALGVANSLANQDYVDLGQLAQVGASREGYAQEVADAPGLNLDRYLGRVTGSVGQSSYGGSRNRAAGAIGGGMLGYQAGNELGQRMGGGNYGMLGGLLGAYLGGWG